MGLAEKGGKWIQVKEIPGAKDQSWKVQKLSGNSEEPDPMESRGEMRQEGGAGSGRHPPPQPRRAHCPVVPWGEGCITRAKGDVLHNRFPEAPRVSQGRFSIDADDGHGPDEIPPGDTAKQGD